jgi:hypothetical protein
MYFLLINSIQVSGNAISDDHIAFGLNFNEGNGDQTFSQNARFTGTIHGGSWINDLDDGYALQFDGVDDYVEIISNHPEGRMLEDLQVGSISIWFKIDSFPENGEILPIFYYGADSACSNMPDAANQGMVVEIGHDPIHENSRRLYYTVWGDGCTFPSFCVDTNIAIEEDSWYHFVMVIEENHNTMYLNGVELGFRNYNFGDVQDSVFFDEAVKNEKLLIGKGYWNAQEMYFNGIIDDIFIYDYVLGSDEVEAIFLEVNIDLFETINSETETDHEDESCDDQCSISKHNESLITELNSSKSSQTLVPLSSSWVIAIFSVHLMRKLKIFRFIK